MNPLLLTSVASDFYQSFIRDWSWLNVCSSNFFQQYNNEKWFLRILVDFNRTKSLSLLHLLLPDNPYYSIHPLKHTSRNLKNLKSLLIKLGLEFDNNKNLDNLMGCFQGCKKLEEVIIDVKNWAGFNKVNWRNLPLFSKDLIQPLLSISLSEP